MEITLRAIMRETRIDRVQTLLEYVGEATLYRDLVATLDRRHGARIA